MHEKPANSDKNVKPDEDGADPASNAENPANTSSSPPKQGTLAWLQTRPLVEVNGRMLPDVHRVPAGATLRTDEERGTRCALVKLDGTPCGAVATRRYGLCMVHSGGGATDVRAMGALGAAKMARLKVSRELLGIGPRTAGNPRAMARLAAAGRAEELAAALLAPIDDRKLGSLERQRAAALVLDQTFPLQSATLELELPADPGDVGGLGWQALQALAARIAPDLDQT